MDDFICSLVGSLVAGLVIEIIKDWWTSHNNK